MNGWWYRASRDQKLAQIEAGVGLGMTARQIAMVSGANPTAVLSFAENHSIPLSSPRDAGRRGGATNAHRRSREAAYFRGERVDLWRDGVQDRSIRRDDEPSEVSFE